MEKDKAAHNYKVVTLKQEHALQMKEKQSEMQLEIDRLEQETQRGE